MCKLFIRNYLLPDIENDQELRKFLVGFGGGVVDCENLVENVKGRAEDLCKCQVMFYFVFMYL